MKKWKLGLFAAIVAANSLISIHPSEAAVPERAIAIGGVQLGATTSYVKRIYGSPRKIEAVGGANTYAWRYGPNFDVVFINGRVEQVITKGNTGISTPAGIKVGSSTYQLRQCYGRPDSSYGNYWYDSQTHARHFMLFDIENDRVKRITIMVNPEG